MLGRQALRSLLRSGSAGGKIWRRSFADAPVKASPAAHDEFIAAWKKVAPFVDPPKTPLSFMPPRPGVATSIPTKVDMVIVPATTGQMGVLPGHVATIAELKPGVMSVHVGDDVKKYFISSGFAFIHANSYTDIIAVEAVPLDRIDPQQVQKGLTDYTQKLASASTDLEKAEAQIGVEVHSALNSALTG